MTLENNTAVKLSQKNRLAGNEISPKLKTRMRRLRRSDWIRDMVQENRLHASDFIYPVFVTEGQNNREPIKTMPGIERMSMDCLIEDLKPKIDNGLNAIALFPVVPIEKKTMNGTEALNENNLICETLIQLKSTFPDLGLITDVALDPYTTHGHDGLLKNGVILNDETVEILARQAITQAQAGADIIAPSDMMDGRIGTIRRALDENGFQDIAIMSYAAKFASGFYGPFRDAVQSGGLLQGDKKTYQMNPANAEEAMHEVALDIEESADMIMIKPGMPYLDIVARVKAEFKKPTFAYHVSGEYAMLKMAAQQGCIDYEQCLIETMLCFKRAGCDGVLSYATPEILGLLSKS